jgi:hypothetical protein
MLASHIGEAILFPINIVEEEPDALLISGFLPKHF